MATICVKCVVVVVVVACLFVCLFVCLLACLLLVVVVVLCCILLGTAQLLKSVKTDSSRTYHINCTIIPFFISRTMVHGMVADGSFGLGFSVISFSYCLVRERNLSGLLWDSPCYTFVFVLSCVYITWK